MPPTPAQIASASNRGHMRWSGVAFDTTGFTHYLAQRDIEAEALDAHGEDLFLAAACLADDRRALAHFEASHLSRVRLYVRRLGRSSDFHEEVAQSLREKLLTSSAPRLGA